MKPEGLKKKLLEALEKKRKRASEEASFISTKTSSTAPMNTAKVSKLQSKMQKKLSGSKFRWLNESLYTKESAESYKLFTQDPELFKIYHEGFATQVKEWPLNPVDIFVKYLESKPNKTVVADMGCGVAQIAQMLHEKMTIHSFDLVAGNEFITACDIAHVPLKKSTVDVVIFALSLMGTNFADFLVEAKRILNERFCCYLKLVVNCWLPKLYRGFHNWTNL
jgi:ribosomal RNA-processing protein 8